jgi:Mlc titration factor MtfA (ptsG expression regulator)
MRRERYDAGFLQEWRELCGHRFRWWAPLDPDDRSRLEGLALAMVADTSWEAANGFELTDEMMVTIAVQAALLVLELPADAYRGVQAIVVHPSTLVLDGEHSLVPGVVSDGPMAILGQASYNGPVLIAWDQALDDARHPGRGHNVVFHEFAHKLDMLDGTVDGTPPLATSEDLQRWVRVCTAAYEEVVQGRGGHSLRSYAGVNPAEFFAVATESFFDDPLVLRREHPELYAVLGDYYRQDPAGWPGHAPREAGADR